MREAEVSLFPVESVVVKVRIAFIPSEVVVVENRDVEVEVRIGGVEFDVLSVDRSVLVPFDFRNPNDEQLKRALEELA